MLLTPTVVAFGCERTAAETGTDTLKWSMAAHLRYKKRLKERWCVQWSRFREHAPLHPGSPSSSVDQLRNVAGKSACTASVIITKCRTLWWTSAGDVVTRTTRFVTAVFWRLSKSALTRLSDFSVWSKPPWMRKAGFGRTKSGGLRWFSFRSGQNWSEIQNVVYTWTELTPPLTAVIKEILRTFTEVKLVNLF